MGTKAREKGVSYLRVSGRGQVEGDGFPRQADAVAAWAKRNRVELVGEFRDEGESGKKELADRPGLAELLDRLESNGVRLVLVEKADRLARDLMTQEIILGQFREIGVRVVEVDGGNDLTVGDDEPTKMLIRQILGAVAAFDRNVIVLKLKAARARIRREQGKCEGKKPYGFRPNERDTLQRIFALYRKPTKRSRNGYGTIARILNDEARPTRHGRPWGASSVKSVLRTHGKLRSA